MRIDVDPTRVADTFSKFTSNPSLQESAQLFARGLPVLEMIQAIAMNENVLRAFAGFESVYPGRNLERSILEKIILRVSQLHQCQFCINSHLAIMQGLGISTNLTSEEVLSQREHLALEYAEHITRDSNRIPEAFFARLRSVFTDHEIVELTFCVGFITMLNRFNNALQIRYHGELDEVKIH
jgi:AhpD family alkylhydroperoxidase